MVTKVKRWLYESLGGQVSTHLQSQVQQLEMKNDYLQESLSNVELELENRGYMNLINSGRMGKTTRKRLEEMICLATEMAMQNPIVHRTVNVQADYIFAQGVRFVAKHPLVQEVIDEFCAYRHNRDCLMGHTARIQAEKLLQVEGNLFIGLFTNSDTGRVQIRRFPTLDIADILLDPDDPNRELFIKRSAVDSKGNVFFTYYPAFGITEEMGVPSPEYLDSDKSNIPRSIEWSTPIYHVNFNKYSGDKFAIPEIWAMLPWVIVYKRFLENWSSIMNTFAKWAVKVTGFGSKNKAAAAKSQLNTTVSPGSPLEKNPASAAGAFSILGKGLDVEAIKTAGATTPASEGAPLLNMAAAGAGLPNTFYGDASVGNYATAKTLDRPTEMKMISRQELWEMVFSDILGYVVLQSAICEEGILGVAGAVTEMVEDPFSNEKVWVIKSLPKVGDQEVSTFTEIIFPEILERNVTDRVRALVNAVTLFGKPLTDIIPNKPLVARWLMEAMGTPNIEQLLPTFIEMWQANMVAGEDGKPVRWDIIPPVPPQTKGGAEDAAQGGDVGANG